MYVQHGIVINGDFNRLLVLSKLSVYQEKVESVSSLDKLLFILRAQLLSTYLHLLLILLIRIRIGNTLCTVPDPDQPLKWIHVHTYGSESAALFS
jgi:hypothetical protein